MARTAFTKVNGVTNGDAAITRTAINQGATGTSGYEVDIDKDERVALIVENTGSATGSVWIESGAFNNADQGQLSVTVGGSVHKVIGPLEGARFKQSDGKLYISSGITGMISAIQV